MKKIKDGFDHLYLPPADVCRGCANFLTDICIQECAPSGDLHRFEPKKIEFILLPELPTPEEWRHIDKKVKYEIIRQQIETIKSVLGKIVEQTGVDLDEHPVRPIVYRQRSSQISSPQQIPGLPDDPAKRNSPHQAKPAPDSDTGVGSSGLDAG